MIRRLLPVFLCFWAGSALAQTQLTSYFQLSQTPNYLANGGPGFVQIDANGHPFIGQTVPGSGTVTNAASLANNSMVVGDGGGAGIKTISGSIGGSFTTAGAVSLTGGASGLTLAFPAGGPFTYTYPLATSTLASLTGTETLTNKTYSGGVLSGTFSGTPTYSGVPKFTGLSAGTQVSCLGLDSSNNVVLLGAGCSAGGGGSGTVTNASNLTDHAPVVGNGGTVGIKTLAALTTGQFSLGVTGSDPAAGSFGRCFSNNSNVIDAAQRTTHGDSNYTIVLADCYVVTSATLTAARTWTLPAANTFPIGSTIQIYDEAGGVSATNSLAIAPNGTNTINGVNNASNSTIAVAYGGYTLKTDGSAKWTATANTIQQAYSCSAGTFASAQSATGVTTCSAAALAVASGAKALATAAIASAACTSAQTATATGTVTTDVVTASFNGDPTAVTGYVPLTTGMLTIIAYPTTDTVNFKVCNNTSASITPGAITLNWRVVR